MKHVRLFLALSVVLILCSAFARGDKGKSVYAFGVATSFSDTVVFYTELQLLDSVKLDKNHFLPERELYSYQLKNYLEYELGCPNYTCMTYFSENRAKLEKELGKVLDKLRKAGSKELIPIDPEAFKFKKPEE